MLRMAAGLSNPVLVLTQHMQQVVHTTTRRRLLDMGLHGRNTRTDTPPPSKAARQACMPYLGWLQPVPALRRAMLLKMEEDWIRGVCNEIAQHKPDVVVTEKGLSDLALHFLTKAGISAIRRLRKTDNNRIARATGATIVHRSASCALSWCSGAAFVLHACLKACLHECGSMSADVCGSVQPCMGAGLLLLHDGLHRTAWM